MKLPKFVTIFLLSCFAIQSEAKNIPLVWDASPSPGIVGYKVYMGHQPETYITFFDVGNSLTKTIENVLPGTYYFAVKGYTLNDEFETSFSNERQVIIPVGTATFTIKSILPKTLYQVILGTAKDTTTTRWEWKTTGALINNFSRVFPNQVAFWYKLPGIYNVTLNKYVGETLVETITTTVEAK